MALKNLNKIIIYGALIFLSQNISSMEDREMGEAKESCSKVPDSLFNIVSKSNGLKQVLKNIITKSPEERKKILEKIPEDVINTLKNTAIDIFLPELDEHFKDKLEIQNKIDFNNDLKFLKFSINGDFFLVASANLVQVFFACKNAYCIANCLIDDKIIFCDFLANTEDIAISTIKSIFLFNVISKEKTKIYDYPCSLGNNVLRTRIPISLSPDRKNLVAFSSGYFNNIQHKIIIFDLDTRKDFIEQLKINYTQIEFKENSKLIIMTGSGGHILVYDISAKQVVSEKNVLLKNYDTDKKYAHLALNNKFILVNEGYKIYLLDDNDNEITMFYDGGHLTYHHAVGRNNLAAFCSRNDGKIYCTKLDDVIKANKLAKEPELSCIFASDIIKNENLGDRSLSFSPDGKYLITSDKDLVYIINVETKKILKTFQNYYRPLYFSDNGDKFAVASFWGNRAANKIEIYNTPKGMAQDLSLEKILSIAAGYSNNNNNNCNVM